jgi:hypothetical protein
MKTFKLISLSILFAAFATIAMANSTVNKYITTTDDLRQVLKEKVVSNFTKPNNLLYEKGVNNLQEDVEIIFFVSPEHTIRILSIICDNGIATEYVKQVLNLQELNVNELLTNKTYRIELKLDYRTV